MFVSFPYTKCLKFLHYAKNYSTSQWRHRSTITTKHTLKGWQDISRNRIEATIRTHVITRWCQTVILVSIDISVTFANVTDWSRCQ